ncbi:hypothetical protein [Streptomyces sp. G1]|uniref:hypothetical protein n=1 Tax=Streptomyces sp. G1 TaxID=361572 RepID=UPI00202EB992|nr:hypothetical protein [Streptomyces sp. G1]MCM1969454.1 hypothetical protein [Streptomyces sp. G1]
MPQSDPSAGAAVPGQREIAGRLAAFLRAADTALDSWDLYSDEHTDLDGWPYDPEAYDGRKAERDRAVWAAFNPLREEAGVLLDAAEADLGRIPVSSVAQRWAWQLGQLRDALDRIEATGTEYRKLLTAHPHASSEARHAAVDARNAEAWNALYSWSVHGRAVLEILTTAVRAAAGPRLAATPPPPAPSATAGHSTRR